MIFEKYVLGADLAQTTDYTALAIVKYHGHGHQTQADVVHYERFPKGRSYLEAVDRIEKLYRQSTLIISSMDGHQRLKTCELVVDGTGVGRPVVDLLRERKLNPRPISIHGGANVTCEGGWWRTPKRDLCDVLAVLAEQGRLRFAKGLPDADHLRSELQAFTREVDRSTAHESFGGRGEHDDLVIAVALACWWAVRQSGVSGLASLRWRSRP